MSSNADEIISMVHYETSSKSEEPLLQQNPGPSTFGELVYVIQGQNPPESPDESLQLNILRAYVNQDLVTFRSLAVNFPMDFRFDITCGYMTLLEMSLLDNAPSEYAEEAIKQNATLNLRNEKRPNRRAIHYAAQSANVEMLKYMIENGTENNRVDINVQDYHGNTALHYLICCWNDREKCKECLTYLLERDSSDSDFKLNLNLRNNLGFTPLHLAVFLVDRGRDKAPEITRLLLGKIKQKGQDHFEDEKVIDTLNKENIKFCLPDNFDLKQDIKKDEDCTDERMLYEQLFQYLIKRNTANFLDLFGKWSRSKNSWILNRADPNYNGTFLQYSCVKGYEDIVKELLKAGADPHYSYNMKFNPQDENEFEEKPIILAYKENRHTILKKLMEKVQEEYSDSNKEEHFYDYGNFYHKILNLSKSPEHYKCFQLVNSLMKKSERSYLVNEKDLTQNTPLHKAAMLGDIKYVYELLKYGSCIKVTNVDGYSPIKYMTASMVQEILDEKVKTIRCSSPVTNIQSTSEIRTSWAKPGEMGAQIYIIQYDFLFEIVEHRKRGLKGSFHCPGEESHLYDLDLKGDDLRSYDLRSYESEKESAENCRFFLECFLLNEIRNCTHLKHLLTHPVLASFITLKWERIQIYYYINLVFYILFCIFLTAHIMVDHNSIKNSNKTQESNNTNADDIQDDIAPYGGPRNVLLLFFLIFSSLLATRELCQITLELELFKYFKNPENWLEIGLIFLCIVIFICDCDRDFGKGINLCTQIDALAILVSWCALLLLLGKHPGQSVYLKMFQTVAKNFAKYLALYFILILAFVLTFYTLFRDCNDKEDCPKKNYFNGFFMSIFKTLIMLTGEFEAGGTIPFVKYEVLSRVIFAAFVLLMTIIFMNLLNGLAVSDTQKIQNDSYLYGTISLVESITRLEKLFLNNSVKKQFALFVELRNRPREDLFDHIEYWTKAQDGWKLYEYFATRLVFHPNLMREKCMYVLPNSGYQIRFRDPELRDTDFKKEEKFDRTYKKPNFFKRFFNSIMGIIFLNHSLNEKIVEDLENLLRDKTSKKSEPPDERSIQQLEDLLVLLKDKLGIDR